MIIGSTLPEKEWFQKIVDVCYLWEEGLDIRGRVDIIEEYNKAWE